MERRPFPAAQAQQPQAQSQPLEQRIADALGDAGITSTAIADLYAETKTALEQAETAIAQTKARAVDVSRPPDFAAQTAIAAAQLRCDWLQAALPKLAAHHRKVGAREQYAAWLPRHQQTKANRDLLAARLRAVYEPFVAQMVPLLLEIAAVDAEIDRVNSAKPVDGGVKSLRSVELEARNISGFGANGISLLSDWKLPAFDQPGRLLWPPPTPPIDVLQVVPAALLTHPGADWAAHQKDAKAQADAEAKRVADYYRRQTREREERDNADARAAQARRQAAST